MPERDARYNLQQYRSPTPSQVGASGNSVSFSQPSSLPGSVQSSWKPPPNFGARSEPLNNFGGRSESNGGLAAFAVSSSSRPSSISFPTTSQATAPRSSPAPERTALPGRSPSNAASGGWAPVVQRRMASPAPNSRGSNVRGSNTSDSMMRSPGSMSFGATTPGSELGPQVSRSGAARPVATSSNLAEGSRRVDLREQDDKPSLASWGQPQRSTSNGPLQDDKLGRYAVRPARELPQPLGTSAGMGMPRGAQSPSNPRSAGGAPSGSRGPVPIPISPANGGRVNASGKVLSARVVGKTDRPAAQTLQQRPLLPAADDDDDDELPTLKQLVQVGTNGAMSSSAQPAGWQESWQASYGKPKNIPSRPAQEHGQLVVALDVDEVLVQYVDGFRKFMQRERPNGPLDSDSIFHEAHNPSSPWRLQFALTGGIDNLEAVPGAAAALRRLRRAGVRLEAVTSRPPIMRESTEALLNKIFPPDTFADAHFVGPGEKGHTCNAIGARALVDDQMPNCVDACACGVICVLFDFCGSYPWSAGITDLPVRCKRIETWAETCNFLLLALGVDPLEHSTQPSEYLLGMKQVVKQPVVTVAPDNITEDYLDALSEAGKQPTEYDLDLEPTIDMAPTIRGPSEFQEMPLRSEPWWQNRDDPPPALQNGYGSYSTVPSSSGVSAGQWAGMEATLDPNASKPFGVIDVSQREEMRQRLQQQQQSLQQQQAALEQQQQILQSPLKNGEDAGSRREPLHAWNSSSGADFRYEGGSQKSEFSASNNGGFLNAGSFNRDTQPYQQPSRQLGSQAGTLPAALPQNRLREEAAAAASRTPPRSPRQARREDEDNQGCSIA